MTTVCKGHKAYGICPPRLLSFVFKERNREYILSQYGANTKRNASLCTTVSERIVLPLSILLFLKKGIERAKALFYLIPPKTEKHLLVIPDVIQSFKDLMV